MSRLICLVFLVLAACSNGGGSLAVTDPASSDSVATSSMQAGPDRLEAGPSYDFGYASQLVSELVEVRGLSGAGLIVVHREHGFIHEEYWGDFGPARISLLASASKPLSAGILLHLSDLGLLDIDAPIADVVPWGAGNPEITTAQLLSSSSGLVGVYPNPVFEPYICQFIPEVDIQDCAEQIFTTTDDEAEVVPPDTTFRYGGAQWQVAGAVAEAVSGKSWAELVEEIYLQPCGLDQGNLGYSNSISVMGNGIDYPDEFHGNPSTLPVTDNPSIEAGAYATPGAYAEFLLMLLRGGECGDGTQVLSQQTVDQMVDDRIDAAYNGTARNGVGYGFGWWVHRLNGRVEAPGAYGAQPTLDPEKGYGFFLILEANEAARAAIASSLAVSIETSVLEAD